MWFLLLKLILGRWHLIKKHYGNLGLKWILGGSIMLRLRAVALEQDQPRLESQLCHLLVVCPCVSNTVPEPQSWHWHWGFSTAFAGVWCVWGEVGSVSLKLLPICPTLFVLVVLSKLSVHQWILLSLDDQQGTYWPLQMENAHWAVLGTNNSQGALPWQCTAKLD